MAAGVQPGAAFGPSTATPDLWMVSDADMAPTQLTSAEVRAQISRGRLGLASQVARAGETQWTRAADRAEFAYGFPHVNFARATKVKGKMREVPGFVAINPNLSRVLDVARKLAADPGSANLGFWLSAHVEWAPMPMIRRTRFFHMWEGFWVAPIVESTSVKPGDWLNVYLLALNLTDKAQDRILRATDSRIQEGMKGNLSFALPPWKWTVQLVSVAATDAPGEYVVGLKTRSGAERAATAVAVGVLTLGSVVYAPGSSGFSVRYRVLPPQVAKSVTDWQAYAVAAASQRFDRAHAVAISDGRGARIPRDAILQRFRPYLTPSVIVAALEDKQRPPASAVVTLFDRFVFDSFGMDGADKAFLAE